MLGHSTVAVTMRYARTNLESKESAPEYLCPRGGGNRFDAFHKPNEKTAANSGHLLWEASWAISFRCTLSSISLTFDTWQEFEAV